MSKWISILLILISICSVQIGASYAKTLFPILGTRTTCFIRVAVAAFVLSAVWRAWRFRPKKQELKQIAFYGVALGVMNFTYYLSLERLPIGLAVALEFTGPLAVALYFSRKSVDFLWAFLASIGIVLILPIANQAGAVDGVGVAFALTAGAAWAFYIVFGKKASSGSHAGMSTTIGMCIALITVAPFSISAIDLGKLVDLSTLLMGIAVGVLSSALPYSLEMIALKRLPAKNFGILMSLSPAIAALAGLIILKESLTTTQLLAIGCILTASLGSALLVMPTTPPAIEV